MNSKDNWQPGEKTGEQEIDQIGNKQAESENHMTRDTDEPGSFHLATLREGEYLHNPNMQISSTVHYAGFWMRFWAYLLDLAIIGSIERLLINPIFRTFDIPLQEAGVFAPGTIATAVVFYAYFVVMTKFFRQTLGKMVFGLKVIDLEGKNLTWGTILFREWIGRFISATIWVGYVIVAFVPKKQGLHDLFADTTVVHERS